MQEGCGGTHGVAFVNDFHVQNEVLMKHDVIMNLNVPSVHENEDGVGTGTIVAASPSPYMKTTPGQHGTLNSHLNSFCFV